MSRLQVGGLALIINSRCGSNIGKVVKLEQYCGDMDLVKDAWLVSCDDLLVNTVTSPMKFGHITSSWLMPLGDKQTQDELLRESELENV